MSKEEMELNPEELNSEELNTIEEQEDQPVDESTPPSGKYDRLLNENSRKFKLSGMFKEWFLDYSSYVILHRAVPHIVDGLKPVQRRVLHAMWKIDDGRYTKVANIIGQAMQYHPHGDTSIGGALVQLGQKNYLIDCQGNWGNILTGDASAAPRYIEARLSEFAKEVVFNPKTTEWMTSYDGRNQEPIELPVKFPLLLAQGAEGIAVGLASKILPHNFNELIDASIAILQGKDFEIYPDFPTGGYADCSKYQNGQRGGSVKVRAKIEKIDRNTLAITEVPFSKTTQAIIDSILRARDKNKIKIRKIDDLTTDKANILIHLPNDVSPDKTIDALYAFTDCEVSISPNTCVIVEKKPQFLGVDEVLRYDTQHTQNLLELELQIKMEELESDWHNNSLEKIFFENRIYKILEGESGSWEEQINEVFTKMLTYQELLHREITMDDINKLVEKPVRKISKFDAKLVDEKLQKLEQEMKKVQDNLDNIVEYTISWFKNLKKKYGKNYPRLTELASFENIEITRVVHNNAKLYANMKEGFVGINLKKEDNAEYVCDCSNLSEIIVIQKDGKYVVSRVSDKAFFGTDIIYVGLFERNDDRTIYNAIYRKGKTAVSYAKRFAVKSITRDKEYDITCGTPGSTILWLTVNRNGEAETVKIYLRPRPKLKKLVLEYDFSELAIKGRAAKGNIVSKNPIQRITLKSKGVSTLGGKDIWFDKDVQRLNEDERGKYLGEFESDDHVLAIFKDGTFYTTSFDLSNRYQGELLKVEKLDLEKVYTALYYDKAVESFYIKRFTFDVSDNTALSFISDAKGSYLVDISDDKYPQVELTFGGKQANREAEILNAEEFIAQKGIQAKGKRVSRYEVKSLKFIEPLHKPEDDIEAEDIENDDNIPTDVAEVELTAKEKLEDNTLFEKPEEEIIQPDKLKEETIPVQKPKKKKVVTEKPKDDYDDEPLDLNIDNQPTLF